MAKIVGIDPGKKGALACIGDLEDAILMPLSGKDIDGRAIRDFLIKTQPDLVYIEKVHSMPKQSSQSGFTFGEAYGTVKGIVDAMEIPYVLVTPQAWKKKVLAGTKKEKQDAIEFCRRRYPNIDLIPGRCKTPQDGIADAVCIAQFGLLQQADN